MTYNPNFRFGNRARRVARDIEITRALSNHYHGVPHKDELAELLRQAVINTGGKASDEVSRNASSQNHVQRKDTLAGDPKPLPQSLQRRTYPSGV